MKNKLILNIVLCGMFIALLVVATMIRIPIGTLSITLQTLVVFLSGMLLGYKWGTISVCCYVMLGLLGLPVFTNGGGLFYVIEPSFGYLLGFIVATFVIGLMTLNNSKTKRLIISGFTGLLIIYLIGLPFFYFISTLYYKITIEAIDLLIYYFLIPLPLDIISIFISVIITKRLGIIKDSCE